MKKNRLKGFSLIEILVVVTIIALLAAGAAVTYSQLTKQSRDARRKTDLEQIRAALEMYKSNSAINQYPLHAAGTCVGYADLAAYLGTMPSDPKTASSYYYNCSFAATDYTIGAYLEGSTPGCSVVLLCKTGVNCNYCVGPYGQK